MDAPEQIRWEDLTHAYGSAADVPDLLRALRTASPELQGEDSPLWQLYGIRVIGRVLHCYLLVIELPPR